MKTFYLWATLMSHAFEEILIAKLVKARFHVAPLGKDGDCSWPGEASSLLALKLTVDPDLKKFAEINASKVSTEVREVLDSLKASYHSLVIYEVGGSCSWSGSNIKLPAVSRFDRVDDDKGSN